MDETSNSKPVVVGGGDVRFEFGTRVFLRYAEASAAGPFWVLTEEDAGDVRVCLIMGRTSRRVVKSGDLVTG